MLYLSLSPVGYHRWKEHNSDPPLKCPSDHFETISLKTLDTMFKAMTPRCHNEHGGESWAKHDMVCRRFHEVWWDVDGILPSASWSSQVISLSSLYAVRTTVVLYIRGTLQTTWLTWLSPLLCITRRNCNLPARWKSMPDISRKSNIPNH